MICEVWTSTDMFLGFVIADPVHMVDFCDDCGDCLDCYGDDGCGGETGAMHRWVVYRGEGHPWLRARGGSNA